MKPHWCFEIGALSAKKTSVENCTFKSYHFAIYYSFFRCQTRKRNSWCKMECVARQTAASSRTQIWSTFRTETPQGRCLLFGRYGHGRTNFLKTRHLSVRCSNYQQLLSWYTQVDFLIHRFFTNTLSWLAFTTDMEQMTNPELGNSVE